MDRTLSGATTPGQSGPGSDDNEDLLRILQSSMINGASPSDCLVSYPGHSWEGSCNILTSKREITSDATWVTAPTTSRGFDQ